MSFWTSETLKRRIAAEDLITPYVERQVAHCAYELQMGPEAFITSSDGKKKICLERGDPVVIPPGQFALLLTEEEISIPLDAIGFISMRFGIKRRGLINVSGFHVDPGYQGRLKFAVYNAGARDITVARGDCLFMIWFSALDQATDDGYVGKPDKMRSITSDDQNIMHGDVASPGELKKEIDQLSHFYGNNKWLLGVLIGVAFGILVRLMFMSYFADLKSDDIDRLKQELRQEIRQEFSMENRNKTAVASALHSLAKDGLNPRSNAKEGGLRQGLRVANGAAV